MTKKVERYIAQTYCILDKIFIVNFYFYFLVNNIYIWKTINVVIENNLFADFLFSNENFLKNVLIIFVIYIHLYLSRSPDIISAFNCII